MLTKKVIRYPLDIIKTPNGNVRHIINNDIEGFLGFSEAYISEINSLCVKGWTLHKNKTSNFIVVKGHVKFVFVESCKPDKFVVHELSSIESKPYLYSRLLVKPNTWFAFQGLHSKVSRVLNISNVIHSKTLSLKKDLTYFKFNWD